MGYAYPLNIAKFSCIVLSEILHRPGLIMACGLRRAKVAARVCVALAITVDIIRPHRVFS